MSAVELDLELLGWVRDFIHEKRRVTVDEVRREFFPDEAGHPYLYLDWITAEGAIEWDHQTGVYEWAHHPEFPSGVESAQKPRRKRFSHRDCLHPNSPWAKEQCRRTQDASRNPADFREKKLRSRWAQFMDDKVHELTAEEIQELTGENTTPHQFERRLRAHASNYGLKCSAKSTENGIRFVIGDSADMDSGVLDYLPREVAALDGWGSQRAAVLSSADKRRSLGVQTSHATCTHPMTKHERQKCRKARAAKTAP
ncbi:hypothetical protein C4J65_10480 [Streptomyces sp. CB09001]|uniref:hypothetical protein n=1 Tax=Streptomyces sp. CB09001 TaxID=2083284 RepID=UPI000E20D38F|nr:hypothetical protein [Streptomyces sp. CB09001]AXL88705.1 hypothetical protein C4J65_10480 [Streptomyces sp. CB09001]